ncbi:MAG TPA: hypothetical protein VI451_20690 [Anaerolineales bacterium]|nr:hypothetical protein [Anaerolineales bacterium]
MTTKALITDSSGGLGIALTHHLQAQNIPTIPWDRGAVPLDDEGRIRAFLQEISPDVLFHLATASPNCLNPSASPSPFSPSRPDCFALKSSHDRQTQNPPC